MRKHMNSITRFFLVFVGINGALATLLAAMASHSPAMAANPYLMDVFAKANSMHYYHLLALLVATGLFHVTQVRWWLASAGMFALGIILFTGSLYLFAFSGAKIAGFLTPFGGISFIVGWLTLIVAAIFSNKTNK